MDRNVTIESPSGAHIDTWFVDVSGWTTSSEPAGGGTKIYEHFYDSTYINIYSYGCGEWYGFDASSQFYIDAGTGDLVIDNSYFTSQVFRWGTGEFFNPIHVPISGCF